MHQFALALPEYTLVVVDANRAYVCFASGRGTRLLGILHEDGHYDALISLPGFFGKGYFCARCYQPYNDAGQHACTNNPTHCGSCLQNGYTDNLEAYAHYQPPTVSCPSCRRSFYVPICLANHLGLTHDGKPAGTGRASVCQSRKKCSGVLNCCRIEKRGRNTAVGMPNVRPIRRWWTFRPTAASSKWHHHPRRTPHDPSTSSSTSKVDRRTDNTSPTWWWPKPKWRMNPFVSRVRDLPPTHDNFTTIKLGHSLMA